MSPGGTMLNSARSRPELPAVVGGRDDRDQPVARRSALALLTRVQQRPQPAQHVGQPRAAADRDDARDGAARRRGLAGGLGG